MFVVNGDFEEFIKSLPDVGGTVEIQGERMNSKALKKRMISLASSLNTLKNLLMDEEIGIAKGRSLSDVMGGIHSIASSEKMNSSLRSFLEGVIRTKRSSLLAYQSTGESLSRDLARMERSLAVDGVFDVLNYSKSLAVTLTTVIENAISDVEQFKSQFLNEVDALEKRSRSPVDKKSLKSIDEIKSSIDLRIKSLQETIPDVSEYIALVAAYNLLAMRRVHGR